MTNDNDRVILTPQGLFVAMFLDLGYPLDTALAYWNTFDNDLAQHDYIIVRADEAKEPTAAETTYTYTSLRITAHTVQPMFSIKYPD